MKTIRQRRSNEPPTSTTRKQGFPAPQAIEYSERDTHEFVTPFHPIFATF